MRLLFPDERESILETFPEKVEVEEILNSEGFLVTALLALRMKFATTSEPCHFTSAGGSDWSDANVKSSSGRPADARR